MTSSQIKDRINRQLGLRDSCSKQLEEVNKEIKHLNVLREKQTDVVKLLSHCLLEFGKTTSFISNFVTEGLNSIYPNSSFKVEFPFTYDSASNPNGLWYVVYKKGVKLEDPKEDLGDGEYSCLIFLIFLGCFLKSTKEGNRVLYLDEPVPAVDKEAWKSLGSVLMQICKEFNCQINMTTHVTEPIGKTFVMSNGRVKEILNDTSNQ